jgi:Tfp pilus assembly protein PilN
MKEHINLASRQVLFEEKPFPFKQFAVPMAIGAAGAVLVLVSLGYAWRVNVLKKEVRELSIQHDKTQQELALLNGEIGSVSQQTEMSRESAANQLEAMKELLKNRIPWSDVIREVSVLVPEGVWLTRMESLDSQPDGHLQPAVGKTMHFIGVAQSQAAVNQFISSLERSPRYGTVSLVFSQKGGGEGVQGVSFELMAAMH